MQTSLKNDENRYLVIAIKIAVLEIDEPCHEKTSILYLVHTRLRIVAVLARFFRYQDSMKTFS